MYTGARLGGYLLLSFFCAAAASAQQGAAPGLAAAREMQLDVVVTAKSGTPAGDLQQQDFTLLDNKAPQTITSFKAVAGRDAPIEVVLVIDTVNTTAIVVGTERLQIDKFLRSEGGSLAYPVALDIFTDSGIQNVANFSSDGNALSAALDRTGGTLRDVGRSAGFWGATERLQVSLNALGQIVASEAPRPGRKLIVWVSPDWPLLSGTQVEISAKEQQDLFQKIVLISTDLRRDDITLYSVDPLGAGASLEYANDYKLFVKGVSKESQAQFGNLGLQVLAIHSGGLALSPTNDMSQSLDEALAESAPYYEISFVPALPEKPNEYHHLEIKVATPGLTARTVDGYYAQPSTGN